ncbi:MAG: hypothetical protein FH749_05435 [Firmicutes bacterium]|nr:hypothetical protein [Bacillota bacterium]
MNNLAPAYKWAIAIVLMLAVNGCVWFLFLEPAIEESNQVKSEIENREIFQQQLEQRLETLLAIDTGSLLVQQEELEALIPPNGQLRELLAELEKMAEESGLTLNSIRGGNPSRDDEYMSLDLTILLEGDYQEHFDYIKMLENHERLLAVDSFNLSRSGDSINANIQISIYGDDFYPPTPYDAPGRDNPFQ